MTITNDYEYNDRYEEIESMFNADVAGEPEEILLALIESRSWLEEHRKTLAEHEEEEFQYIETLLKKIKSKLREVRYVLKHEQEKDEPDDFND